MQKIIKLIFSLIILFSLMDCQLCFSNEEANIVGNKGLAFIREGKVEELQAFYITVSKLKN